ncbi:hypothetical protein JCM15519_38200 [Fundidesulfovibrio butyratiphilus]
MSYPATWQIKTLGDLCEIARGGSPRPIQKYLTDDEDGINWIKISDATASSKYIFETKEKIKPEGSKRSRVVVDGDFILSNSMSFGRPYIMKTSGCIHDGWLVLKDKTGLFDQDYLYYFLGSHEAYSQFDRLAAGSTVRNLNIDLVKRVNVTIPPIQEQKRIVAILDEAFERIDTAIANTENNLANARELFESHLSKAFDAKAHGWPIKRFEDICENLDSRRIPITKSKRESGEIPYYGASGIVDYVKDFIFNEDILLVSEDGANLLARTYPIAFSVSGKSWVNNHAHVLRFKNKSTQAFVELYLNSISLEPYVNGMAQPKLNQKSMNSITVPFPDLAIQQEIVNKLTEIKQSTSAIKETGNRKAVLLGELKQSLLQKAFSGELTTDFNPEALEH